ncbi:MAG: sialate O-acetylesterase [Pirellulaceae bacterium]
MKSLFRPAALACAALVALLAVSARAEVRLPKVLSSHMVVQQEQPIAVWGWADAGEEVTVVMGDAARATKAGDDGSWSVQLPARKASSKPAKITIKGENEIVLEDVLVGEVWVCSGQSNMQWSVRQANNPDEEIANAKHPNIRLFTVARNPAETPQSDCVGANQGSWDACSPQTVGGFSAVGYFFGRELSENLDVPIGLINSSWGGTICEAWTSDEKLHTDDDFQPILERSATFKPGQPNQASVLFNGMIQPLLPLSIRGAIWYQGESNVGRAAQYAKLFPAMIEDWREQFRQADMPFVFVQLAPYRYGRNDPALLAEQWESQLKTVRKLDNVGMAVTTDIGNTKDIHPKNKQEVGRRLALWALANTYGKKDLAYSGPLYKSSKVEGGKIRITFDYASGGLVAEGGGPLTHFTIAGENGEFVEATAEIDGEEVVVSSDKVAKPVAVRFAWSDTAEPNLFNKVGLPASPFRTDDFKLLTADNK